MWLLICSPIFAVADEGVCMLCYLLLVLLAIRQQQQYIAEKREQVENRCVHARARHAVAAGGCGGLFTTIFMPKEKKRIPLCI